MKPPPSPSRPFVEQMCAFASAFAPDMHVLVLAVHPSVPENCSLGASNMPKWLAARLLREQADGLEADLSEESAEKTP